MCVLENKAGEGRLEKQGDEHEIQAAQKPIKYRSQTSQ